jgi:hypothetical protein
MTIVTTMTELEAVNEMLMSIGQAPVNSLAVTGIKDVAIARQRLRTALRSILSMGWWFNTDEAFDLTPDLDGNIVIPVNALKVDSDGSDITERNLDGKGRCLYNRAEQSFEFADPVTVRVVWGFEYEDIPQTARDYIGTVAARRFQSKVIGSQILDRFEQEDEIKAYIALIREDRASRRTNLFTGNRGISAFGRRSY